ncbi:MAG: membrane-associated protease 1 [Lachnospiraceae bacterium]
MGLRLNITGSENINLNETIVKDVKFGADIPKDSNARSTDLGATITIIGKILAAVGGEAADDTMKLAKWALIPAENADCYRRLQIEVISASQVVRRVNLPNAFVIGYEEDFADESGVGTFTLTVKQKKDKMKTLSFEGGFAGE